MPEMMLKAPTSGIIHNQNDTISDLELRELLARTESEIRTIVADSHLQESETSDIFPNVCLIPEILDKFLPNSYSDSQNGVMKVVQSRTVDPNFHKLASEIRKIDDSVAPKICRKDSLDASAGPNWFNLPKTVVTPELKRDMQVLKMRNALDPKRHYRQNNSNRLIPDFSQTGTIIEGPTEFFSARLSLKERKKSLVEELLQTEQNTKLFKNKYEKIQQAKRSGRRRPRSKHDHNTQRKRKH